MKTLGVKTNDTSVCVSICAPNMPACVYVYICICLCACKHACVSSMCVHACLLHLPMPHVAQPRRKTPIVLDQKEKQTFWMKVFWSSVGPFIFLVIIIYSLHIDNAPTQTLQGIIHSVRGDVAVPQIVQTTGQSPEPHNSMSKGRKKPPVCHCVLILRISPLGTKCILTCLTV